jgi:hypothetical protein
MALSATEREACYLARRLNVSTGRTLKKWQERAKPYQPFVDALRPHIEKFDKLYCYARSEEEAVKATIED